MVLMARSMPSAYELIRYISSLSHFRNTFYYWIIFRPSVSACEYVNGTDVWTLAASMHMVNTMHIRIYWRYQFELFVYVRIIVLVRHPCWYKDLVSNLFRSTYKTRNWFHCTWQSYLDSHQNIIEHSLYIYYSFNQKCILDCQTCTNGYHYCHIWDDVKM